MVERLRLAANQEYGVLVVRPAAVRVDDHADPILHRLERVLEKRRRADAEALGVPRRDQLEFLRISRSLAHRHRDLCARDGQRLDHRLRRGLPEPVPDLVVIGLDLAGLHDVLVVPQAVVKLRAVGLGIDRLQFDAVDVRLPLRAIGLWIDVETSRPGPDAGQGPQRSEIPERIDVDVRWLGIDVLRKAGHDCSSLRKACNPSHVTAVDRVRR